MPPFTGKGPDALQPKATTRSPTPSHRGALLCMLKTMWWFLTTSALANPVVEVFVNNQSIARDLVATIEGEEISLRDDGRGVDRQAGDGYWSGEMTTAPGLGRSQPLSVHDSTGTRWVGGLEWSEADPPVGVVGLESDGTLIKPPFPSPATVPSLRDQGEATNASPQPTDAAATTATTASSTSSSISWLLAALGWGLFVGSVLRQSRTEPVALPGTPSTLAAGMHRVQASPEQASQLLVWLTHHHRVILIGEIGATVPAGTVFVPRSANLGDITTLLEALTGRGRPVVLLLIGDRVNADVVTRSVGDLAVVRVGTEGTLTVAEDGALVPA